MWKNSETPPEREGYYVVQAITMMGNLNAFKCYFNGHKFECSNQKVIKWIDL